MREPIRPDRASWQALAGPPCHRPRTRSGSERLVAVVDDDRNTPTWTHVRAGDDEGFVLLEFVHARC